MTTNSASAASATSGPKSLAGVNAPGRPSPLALARLFREQLGTIPARYVESARVEAAKALLRSGHTVSAAAARSGFGSTETLRWVFAAQVGVSPSAYASEDVPDRSSATVPAEPV